MNLIKKKNMNKKYITRQRWLAAAAAKMSQRHKIEGPVLKSLIPLSPLPSTTITTATTTLPQGKAKLEKGDKS